MNTRTNHGAIVPIERIELPPFTLPTPPPGMKWHREDGWNDGDLPQGTRPFIEGEMPQKDDLCILDGRPKWTVAVNWWSDAPASPQCRYRTTRPLLFTHEGHEWTWHRAGDPMPCNGDKMVVALTEYGTATAKASQWQWGDDQGKGNIIGWRVLKWREKKPKVPLGPEDVPPGSVFCVKDRMPGTWHGVLGVYASTVQLDTNRNTYSFYELQQEEWLINRSIPMTGKWDANAWEACEK